MQQAHIKDLIAHHKEQLEQIVTVHNREFDALMEMIGRPREPVTGTQATPPPQRGGHDVIEGLLIGTLYHRALRVSSWASVVCALAISAADPDGRCRCRIRSSAC